MKNIKKNKIFDIFFGYLTLFGVFTVQLKLLERGMLHKGVIGCGAPK